MKTFLESGCTEKAAASEYVSLLKKIQLKQVHRARSVRVKTTISKLQDDDKEGLSVKNFWQLKKCVSRKTDSKTSVITEKGTELFDDPAILCEYVKEFKARLSHRDIDPDLTAFQAVSHKLLQMYIKQASLVSQPPFTVSEVRTAFFSFISGKSPGSDLFPPDILPHAGPAFISAVTNVLNNIKEKLVVPNSWLNVIITTLYKNKGSRKHLKNHRGIFLTSIFSKIMEKLIKTRIQGKLEGISPFQFATPNHSTADCLFIIYSLIDHAKYLNSPLYLTFYDYSTCFDSLWLEDTMLCLWDLGIQDDIFSLIFKMNETCDITIRTPYGTSDPFTCSRIVKQGAVLSTSLCGSTTSQLTKELDQLADCGANILSAQVKEVLFVDDTTTANNTTTGTVKSHEQFMRFSRRKRLGVNATKCFQVIVNPPKGIPPPLLMIGDQEIQSVKSTKCLGDIVSANGSMNDLIMDRINKGKAIIVSALSLCNDITLGHLYIESALLLHKAVFLQSVLFNSQAWSNITKTQISQLRRIQLKYLKRTLQVPNSTPNAFTFLELGVLPIEYEIHKRQLMYLHHIHTLPHDDPVHHILQQQKQLSYSNWYQNVLKLLLVYQLSEVPYAELSKSNWKHLVTTNIRKHAFDHLKQECSNMTKTYHIQYENFQTQPYITSSPSDIASLIFKIRARVLSCRDNHHHTNRIITCRLCKTHIETQDHIINCKEVNGNDEYISLQPYLSPSFEVNLDVLNTVKKRYQEFHRC